MLPSLALSGLIMAVVIVPWASPFSVGTLDLGIFFLIEGISFAAGMGLITRAPHYIPATQVGLIMLLETVLGATWAWIILSERPGLQSLLGGTLVIGALIFNSLIGWKKMSHRNVIPGSGV